MGYLVAGLIWIGLVGLLVIFLQMPSKSTDWADEIWEKKNER